MERFNHKILVICRELSGKELRSYNCSTFTQLVHQEYVMKVSETLEEDSCVMGSFNVDSTFLKIKYKIST